MINSWYEVWHTDTELHKLMSIKDVTAASKEKGEVSISWVVRRAIEEYLHRQPYGDDRDQPVRRSATRASSTV